MKQNENTFYEYVNPICFSIGIIGFLLYFGVDYFEIGITLGLWGVTGALGIIEAKKINYSLNLLRGYRTFYFLPWF